MYWNKPIETMKRKELEGLQLARLRHRVQFAYSQVAPFRDAMQVQGLLPEDVRELGDLCQLPFTTKQHLRDSYPFGRLGVPLSQVVRIHASSGTTGKPTTVAYTRSDLDIWAECAARCLVAAGCDKDDVVQVSYGYGLFTGGLGLHYGAERLGASVIPTSSGNSQRQATIMADFGTTAICCTPSFALYMIDVLKKMQIDPLSLPLRRGIFGAEPWSTAMREQIEQQLGIDAFDIYGLSEVMGPGVAMECPAKDGLHIFEDHFYPEIIDPHTLEALPPGQVGELVLTCLTKEGMPMIRYRTRDLCSLDYAKCPCGRTLVRMSKVVGRSDDMLIIRGVNVFPSQVEAVLLSLGDPGISMHYHIIVDRKNNLDTVEVQVEVSEELLSDKIRALEGLRDRIKRGLANELGLNCKITLVESQTLARSEGKGQRVTDRRTVEGGVG
ncbi:MAG: phenylacetate--CoA ligase [Clostridiales bacterium]|nr:phenylacetate--CoA ligase [Clostridiales bacterium]